MRDPVDTEHSFSELGVSSFFIERLKERGITQPTGIQERVIKRLYNGEKLLFRSPTGTGKTYAYLLPLLGKIMENPSAQGPVLLICAPTYELCSQIKGELDFLLKGTELKSSLLVGQANLSRQIEGIKKEKAAALVGNPGRLLLLAKMNKLKLGNLQFLILDEGDRLVSDELLEETRELTELVKQKIKPDQKDSILIAACSATFSSKSQKLLLPLLGEGAVLEESSEDILREKVEHWAVFSPQRDKLYTLCSFIAAVNPRNRKAKFKALIFTGRGREAGKIVSLLQRRGLAAAGLWGDLDKKERKKSLDDFRSGRINLLVSSDLSARGLDIPGISHIISLDLGEDPNVYIHRAGRTARAGNRGIMVSIGNEEEMHRLAALEKRLSIKVHPKELYQGKIRKPVQDDDKVFEKK